MITKVLELVCLLQMFGHFNKCAGGHMRGGAIAVLIMVLLVGFTTLSYAVPITYEINGKITGYTNPLDIPKDVQYFKEVNFVLSVLYDTDNIEEKINDEYAYYAAYNASGFMSVDGVGLFDCLINLQLLQSKDWLYISDSEKRFDFNTYSDIFGAYDLKRSLATTTPSMSSIFKGFKLTNDEDLLVAEYTYVTSFSAEAAPVPEPSTFLLFAGGVAGLVWVRRRKL